MQGYKVIRKIGWDTHGLPIENALTKNSKIKRKETSPFVFEYFVTAFIDDNLISGRDLIP